MAVACLFFLGRDVLQPSANVIPYGQFKQYLAHNQVAKVEINDTDLTGELVPARGPGNDEATRPEPAKSSDSSASAKGTVAPASKETASQASAKGSTTVAATSAGESKAAGSMPNGKDSSSVSDKTSAANAKGTVANSADESVLPPITTPSKPFRTYYYSGMGVDRDLTRELEKHHVPYSFASPSLVVPFLINYGLPLALVAAFLLIFFRGLRNASQAVMGFGRTRARVAGDKDTNVKFEDVAGCDEAKYELQEVVDFLKNPLRYTALGAKIPKGVLLVGPPGTGKTLLSRAVAGEAGVPFFSLSGSEFVEMFVGVGAARVRDLFEQAKAQAPCIIFIDELDAIGRERGVHMGQVNDEREQTLNQLLVEMDGFEANVGVILLAATNRPEVLDRALLRPGRFDRQVVIDAPDLEGRLAVLKVHIRNKRVADDIDLRKIAQGTPGFSGADLANALNEAALIAARRKGVSITQPDLEEAVEKVVAGPERRTRRLVEEEKRRVAYHETGHALVATYSSGADEVHKISIVPRGRAALGYTLQLPSGEQFLMTRSDLLSRIRGLLGGRAAEEVVFAEVSTGAENDLDRATSLARQMVAVYGMSDKIGLIHCASRSREGMAAFMGNDGRLDCSDETADRIDGEVKVLLESAYTEAKEMLRTHRDQLEIVAKALIERESLGKSEFLALIGRTDTTGNSPFGAPSSSHNGPVLIPNLDGRPTAE